MRSKNHLHAFFKVHIPVCARGAIYILDNALEIAIACKGPQGSLRPCKEVPCFPCDTADSGPCSDASLIHLIGSSQICRGERSVHNASSKSIFQLHLMLSCYSSHGRTSMLAKCHEIARIEDKTSQQTGAADGCRGSCFRFIAKPGLTC